jgi:hypothetical protein
LLKGFGAESLQCYPETGLGDKQTFDFAVKHGDAEVLIEATCLNQDNKTSLQDAEKMQTQDRFASHPPPIPYQLKRLKNTIAGKVEKAPKDKPWVLCLNQTDPWPSPEHANEAINAFLSNLPSDTRLYGIAYFRESWLHNIQWSSAVQNGDCSHTMIEKALAPLQGQFERKQETPESKADV